MPAARWTCTVCGVSNKANASSCTCGARCPSHDTGQWACPGCGQTVQLPVCPGCNYRKPLSKEGVPQIFEGVRCVFTGIIPRSIPHWSEWKEWQEAEQHGATPLNEISPDMTHLIYKEGFERSDKVRKAQKLGHGIKVVVAEWFYQSINLGVRLDEDPYNLTLPQKRLVAASVQGEATDLTHSYAGKLTDIASMRVDASSAKQRPRPSQALTEDGEFHWMVPPKEPRALFNDCTIVFSPHVDDRVKKLAATHSARITQALDGKETTHFVIAPEDEKLPMVGEAAKKGLSTATSEWVIHCIQLSEVLPVIGPYEVLVAK